MLGSYDGFGPMIIKRERQQVEKSDEQQGQGRRAESKRRKNDRDDRGRKSVLADFYTWYQSHGAHTRCVESKKGTITSKQVEKSDEKQGQGRRAESKRRKNDRDDRGRKELVKILQCKQIECPRYEVQIVFYDVKPDVVRKQTDSYAEAFAKHQVSNTPEVNNWKEALFMAANLSGWDLQDMTNGCEYKFIDCISKDILKKLCDGSLHVGENLVGIDFHFDKLDLSRFVGSDKKISCVGEGSMVIKQRMACKPILLVLDDVDHRDQLKALVGSASWFCPGSLIIVTGKDRQMLRSHRVDEIHDMKFLDKDQSLQLFSFYAFEEKHPSTGFQALAEKAVKYLQTVNMQSNKWNFVE
ncbi:NB-ARC domains-containing protein, partial [Tanacetum coccineum]